ncbi:hypothetical protein BSKO_06007 [Bryopsis sp. KO-2023]|nr:hypothetical protein BSKO_06007 [Bryopsis sp. KO-2023]
MLNWILDSREEWDVLLLQQQVKRLAPWILVPLTGLFAVERCMRIGPASFARLRTLGSWNGRRSWFSFPGLLVGVHVTGVVLSLFPSAGFERLDVAFQVAMVVVWGAALGLERWSTLSGNRGRGLVSLVASGMYAVLAWGLANDVMSKGSTWAVHASLGLAITGLLGAFGNFRLSSWHSQENGEPVEEVESAGEPSQWRKLGLFVRALKYVWPRTLGLKVRAVVCLVILIFTRILKVATPMVFSWVIDGLSEATELSKRGQTASFGEIYFPCVALWTACMFLSGARVGGKSPLEILRQSVFFPITQFAHKTVSTDFFQTILERDLHFHLTRKTGEITRVMERGTKAVQTVLQIVIFEGGPLVLDMAISMGYLCKLSDPWVGLVVASTLAGYMPFTVMLTKLRMTARKEMNKKDNEKGFRCTDAFLNYETVKYFNNVDFERDRFVSAVDEYLEAEHAWNELISFTSFIQQMIMVAGSVGGATLGVWSVVKGEMSVGDFTLFLSLVSSLFTPLSYVANYYRRITNSVTDLDNLFQLLDARSEIQDIPGAKPLKISNGEITFEKVSFKYQMANEVLRGVDFRVPGGGTVGLVGATGSGKSTCLRLLFRLYDPTSGCVRIDGQRIDQVTLESLEESIAYVPQDCVLFNDTIMYNIRYGNTSSTDEQVKNAARMATIHEKIVTRFPAGYDTLVGERGLRLSGGERQRVAFARAMLKNAPILMLDEATASLDSITEKKIQAAMNTLRQDRTTLIVAHRLSTVVDADSIIVLHDGEVVERGTHSELLSQNGLYAELWSKQESRELGRSSIAISEAAEGGTNDVEGEVDATDAVHEPESAD